MIVIKLRRSEIVNFAPYSASDLVIINNWLNNNTMDNETLPSDISMDLEKIQTMITVLQYLSIISFIFYSYVVFVIIKHLKVTLNNPFYAYVISLAISDFLVLMQIGTRLSERGILRKPPWFWISPFIIQLSWYANLFNVLGLTGTRFVAVVLHRRAKDILQWRNVIISLILVWLCSIVWALPILISSQRECALDNQGHVIFWELAASYRWVEIVFSIVCMFVCLVLYVIMFEFVRRTRCKLQRHKSRASLGSSNAERENMGLDQANTDIRERSWSNSTISHRVISLRQELPILIQSFLITTSLAMVLFCSYAYVVVDSNFLAYALNQGTALVNSAMNPVLYVIFSTAVRKLVFTHAHRNFVCHLTNMKRISTGFWDRLRGREKASKSVRTFKANHMVIRKISYSCPAFKIEVCDTIVHIQDRHSDAVDL